MSLFPEGETEVRAHSHPESQAAELGNLTHMGKKTLRRETKNFLKALIVVKY